MPSFTHHWASIVIPLSLEIDDYGWLLKEVRNSRAFGSITRVRNHELKLSHENEDTGSSPDKLKLVSGFALANGC